MLGRRICRVGWSYRSPAHSFALVVITQLGNHDAGLGKGGRRLGELVSVGGFGYRSDIAANHAKPWGVEDILDHAFTTMKPVTHFAN